MSRLGSDNQREHERAERSPDSVATPIDVRVPAGGPGVRGASVDGSLVVAAPGEEIQHAVLNRLHRLALAAGHPVLATVHDRRIGYSVPLRVDPDGASHLAADPVPTASEEAAVRRDSQTHVLRPPAPEEAPVRRDSQTHVLRPPAPEEAPVRRDSQTHVLRPPAPEEAPVRRDSQTHVLRPPAPEEASVRRDSQTRLLRPPAPVRDSAPTFPLPALSRTGGERVGAEPAPTFALRAVPEPAGGTTPPGTVAPPTGVFGPPPRMDGAGAPGAAPRDTERQRHPEPAPAPQPAPAPEPAPAPGPDAASAPEPKPAPVTELGPRPDSSSDPDPKPTPARGFDAVAEAVLGDGPLTAPGDATAPALLAEPTARINEAVKEGRTEDAARLAEQTVTETSDTLGAEHPEVLRLRELTAYIAYLSGDPDRAFALSLDLARIHRRSGDAEAAYGNVQSAATAWRAVRDPARGLELGHELVGLWDELAAEDGPAAEDAGELESARTRMGRLTRRVGAQAG
ncbi:tetratricopeptide repeat protein [Streptomyces sp. NPDC048224]|uniref:tetratricopeptide repeat protein n=1 Tax=Streptomyces sp. NPDC048224 TaxID=3154500 RepID=UPI00340FB95D